MEVNAIVYGAAAKLVEEVLDTDLCSGCGACIGYCPYIKTIGERVAVIHDCNICEGVCYRVCPRASTNYQLLRQEVFGSAQFDPVLGTYENMYFARAGNELIHTKGQYGGVVTAIFAYALKQGLIEGALMTGGDFTRTKPAVVSTVNEMLACTGSKYTASPTLSLFQEAVKKGFQNIGIVGRPCQVTAARKMQEVTEIKGERISLVVGLFCMESFTPDFYDYIKENNLDEYYRMDIPKDVQFERNGENIFVPFDEVRKFVCKSCYSCFDPLSELADLSVGSTEHDPGWNTLIVRTEKGAELVKKAVARGVIETKPYPKELLPLLRKAVFYKKKRVLEGPDTNYLELTPYERKYFLATGVDV